MSEVLQCQAQSHVGGKDVRGEFAHHGFSCGSDIDLGKARPDIVQPPVIVGDLFFRVAGVCLCSFHVHADLYGLSGTDSDGVVIDAAFFVSVSENLERLCGFEDGSDDTVGAHLELFPGVVVGDGVVTVTHHEDEIVFRVGFQFLGVDAVGDDDESCSIDHFFAEDGGAERVVQCVFVFELRDVVIHRVEFDAVEGVDGGVGAVFVSHESGIVGVSDVSGGDTLGATGGGGSQCLLVDGAIDETVPQFRVDAVWCGFVDFQTKGLEQTDVVTGHLHEGHLVAADGCGFRHVDFRFAGEHFDVVQQDVATG